MDPEIKRELEEVHALAKDNHRLLRAMRRHQIYGLIWMIVVWAIVLALPLYLYQKYLEPIFESGFQSSEQIQNLVDSFKAGQ